MFLVCWFVCFLFVLLLKLIIVRVRCISILCVSLCLCAFLLSLFACLSICGFVSLILCGLHTLGLFASIDYIVFAG
jgi:hypothetical protein